MKFNIFNTCVRSQFSVCGPVRCEYCWISSKEKGHCIFDQRFSIENSAISSAKLPNCASFRSGLSACKTMNFASEMLNFVSKMMNFVFKVMDSALKMMNFGWITSGKCVSPPPPSGVSERNTSSVKKRLTFGENCGGFVKSVWYLQSEREIYQSPACIYKADSIYTTIILSGVGTSTSARDRICNYAFKMMNFVVKMMNLLSKMMNFVYKMMNLWRICGGIALLGAPVLHNLHRLLQL